MEDPRVGLVLADQYLIHERLAAGGTGVVYRATHAQAGEVAVKFLHDSAATSATGRGRFRREAEAMRRLTHPNLTGIIGFGSHHGSLYLVMELCEGVSLRRILEPGPLDLPRAVNIIRQIVAGLGMAHDAGVVHRDLKPANLQLTPRGRLVLLDFGIAKITSAAIAEARRTRTGALLGSPHYISPELARGEPAGVPSDIYSMGVILYEMLCGAPPFAGSNLYEVLHHHASTTPPPPSTRAAVDPLWDDLLASALAKQPDHRFHSARAMRNALASLR